MRLVICMIILEVILSSCPNGCNGHGKCGLNGVCICEKESGSSGNPLYYGADCSIKACGYGDSFISYSSVSVAEFVSGVVRGGGGSGGSSIRRELKSVKMEEYNISSLNESLSNYSSNRNLDIRYETESVPGYYSIFGIEFALLNDDKGELICKNDLNEYIDKMKIIGRINRIDGKSDGYLIKVGKRLIEEIDVDGNDISSIFIRYNCYISFTYNDLSLMNPTISSDKKIIWERMKPLLKKVGISISNNDGMQHKFACLKSVDNDLDVYSGTAIESDTENNIEFTIDDLDAGLMCYYLGGYATNQPTKEDLKRFDISKVRSLQLSEGKDIGLGNEKKMYKIYNFNPLPSGANNKYGLLNCFNKYTNELIGKAYLMGYEDNKKVSKIIYDFENDDKYDSYDIKCEIMEEYSEITCLYPMKVLETTGIIIKTGIKEVIPSLSGSNKAVVLGCYNPTSYIFTTYPYTYTSSSETFTFTPGSSGGGGSVGERRNLETLKPSKNDICYILMNNEGGLITDISDEGFKLSSFYSKHLILDGKDGKYKYYDENSIVKLPGLKVKDNIYILENITFNSGSSGSLMECENVKNKNEIIEIQILKKIEPSDDDGVKLNKYYIRYNNNKILNGNFKCSLIHQTNDLSLYELSKPNNCVAKNEEESDTAKCDLKLISMSYFLTVLPNDIKMDLTVNNDVKIACSRGDSIEIYNYEYNKPKINIEIRLSTTAEDSEDVTFTIKTDSPIVPSNNDICHIIHYTPKSQSQPKPRRVRRLTGDDNDLDYLMKSDYGKSLSSYIYKPSESIKVDIGKMNHKVYEVNNIEIIPNGIDIYVGKMKCKYNNNNNEGIGYIMGKSKNGYMILFDFVNENIIPSINSYICELENIYNDLSLYYVSEIVSQIWNGFGECYSGKCDIKWLGMGKLLNKVEYLSKDKTGKAALDYLKSASSPLKFVCMNKAKKVSIYSYTGDGVDNNNDLTFLLKADSQSYPLVGHICNILSGFDGSNKYDSEYILNPPNGSKLPPTLINDSPISIETDKNVYKVRRFNPSGSSIGYSICKNNEDESRIIGYNYGKIQSEKWIDSYYIRYTDGNGKTEITSPSPELYSCKSFIEFKDTSSLIKAKTPNPCDSANNCQLILSEGYKEILENMGIVFVAKSKTQVSFACYSQSDILTLYSYECTSNTEGGDIEFSLTDGVSDYPKASSECSLLLDLKGNKIENLKDSEITLLSSKTKLTSFNGKTIWKVTNINYGNGIIKCYNKYSNEYIGDAIYYGRMKDEDENYISLVSYSDFDGSDMNNPTPEDYNCKLYKSYNDLSLLLPSDTPTISTCSAKDNCYFTFSGIKPLLKSIGVSVENDFNVGCEMKNEIKQLIFTTKQDGSDSKTTPAADENNLVLYIKKGQSYDYSKLKRCYLLLDSDGNKLDLINSDINKLPFLSSEVITSSGIYYGYNLNLNYESGIMRCYNNENKYSGDLIIYSKEKEKEIYKVKLPDLLKIDNFNKYSCQESIQFNDLSLFNPINIPEAINSGGKITWSNMKTILEEHEFKIEKINEKKENRFVCINKETKSVSYVNIQSATYNPNGGDNPNLEFTVTEIAVGNTCYLLSKFDGSPITGNENIKSSDVGKMFELTGENSQSLPSLSGDNNPILTPFGDVYKVQNVEYDIKENSVVLVTDCIDKTTSSHLGESYVLSKSENNDYNIYYSWIKDTNPKPEVIPANYECSEIGSYSDLSLIFETTITSDTKFCYPISESQPDDASCDITLENLNTIFTSFTKSNEKYQFICSNSRKELNLYEYTIKEVANGDVIFSIDKNSEKVPYVGDKCNLLANTKGEKVVLSKSEYGKKNGIYNDNINGEKIETNEKKVESVNEESIPVEIPKSGGVLKCFDKESGEYVGTIEVLGKKSDGSAIVKYNIENSKMDINEEDLNIDLFETKIDKIRNDLSLVNPPKVGSVCEMNVYSCILIWKYMGEILIESDRLLNDEMNKRYLSEKEMKFACADANDKNIYKEVIFKYNDANMESDLKLSVKSIPCVGFKFSVNSECNALMDGDKNEINLKNSEFYKIAHINEEGEAYLVEKDKVLISNRDDKFIISIPLSKINGIEKYIKKSQIPIPIEDSIEGRNLYNQISLGKTIKIVCSSSSYSGSCTSDGCEKVIIGIEKVNDIRIISNRLLLENERMLADPLPGVVLQFNDLSGITATAGSSINLFVSRSSDIIVHNSIECSGVGICNRESGICECYDGFSGSSCERMNCVKNCNNHGRCISNKELNENVNGYNGFGNEGGKSKIYGCLCDLGYRGVDCSLKECPSESVDRDCSNHGICNYESGECECFGGYYGESCNLILNS